MSAGDYRPITLPSLRLVVRMLESKRRLEEASVRFQKKGELR